MNDEIEKLKSDVANWRAIAIANESAANMSGQHFRRVQELEKQLADSQTTLLNERKFASMFACEVWVQAIRGRADAAIVSDNAKLSAQDAINEVCKLSKEAQSMRAQLAILASESDLPTKKLIDFIDKEI